MTLPTPYPDEIRHERWTAFWAALATIDQQRLDNKAEFSLGESGTSPFFDPPHPGFGFPDRIEGCPFPVIIRTFHRLGLPGVIEAIRLGADPFVRDDFGRDLISWSMDNKAFACLVGWGFDFNRGDESGTPAIFRHFDNPAVIEAALDLGFDPTRPFPNGNTPFGEVARRKNSALYRVNPTLYDQVEALLKAGVVRQSLNRTLPAVRLSAPSTRL